MRVARFDLGKGRGQVEDLVALDALHGELRQLVRRHLPDVTASVLARPRVAPDGESIEWYSDLAGQPGPLTALPAARRAAIRSKLDARLEALRRLAAALPRKVKGSERIAEALARAARDPDDSRVYVVGDEPVIIRWGDAAPDRIDEAPIQGAAVGEPPRPDTKRTRRVSLLVGLLLLTLAGAGTALWLWLGAQETGQLEAELAAATAAGCDGLDRLDALALRLDRQDPERLDYTDLRARIRDWHALCERATALEREIESSGWDCARLVELERALTDRAARPMQSGSDLEREPFAGLVTRLTERVAHCTRAQQTLEALERHAGDCGRIKALADGFGDPDPGLEPLQAARERLAQESLRCREADRIVALLDTTLDAEDGACARLGELERAAVALDVSRPPLAAVHQRMLPELARCARAQELRRALLDAQMDCTSVRAIARDLSTEEAEARPMREIRRQLDDALRRCEALDALGSDTQESDH